METIRQILRQHRVLDLGPLPAPRLPPKAAAQQALQFLVRGRRGAIVVVEPPLVPVGIYTERDVVDRFPEGLLASREHRAKTPLSELMSRPPVTIRRQASLLEAIDTMSERGFRQLVVVDRSGELKGLVTTSDIVQYLTDQFPAETVNLPPRLNQRFASPEGA